MDTYNALIKYTRLANMKIKDIRRHHVQPYVDEKVKEGLSAYRTNYAYGIIRNAFNTAVQRGLIPVSYADKVSLPKKKPKKTAIFNPEQQNIFLKAIKGHRLEAAFIVVITTGMREGELASLTWKDYDREKGTLTVNKDAIRVFTYDPVTKKKTGSELITGRGTIKER